MKEDAELEPAGRESLPATVAFVTALGIWLLAVWGVMYWLLRVRW